MNQIIETAKIKGARKLTNKCELASNNTYDYYVGGKHCDKCPFFLKRFTKDGKSYIHCNHIKANEGKVRL